MTEDGKKLLLIMVQAGQMSWHQIKQGFYRVSSLYIFGPFRLALATFLGSGHSPFFLEKQAGKFLGSDWQQVYNY